MPTRVSLPPATVFTNKETLHAIELPPLASFLSTLEVPEHLLKLNDILDRYRTPKSYHRIDVREVSSSELLHTADEDQGEEGGEQRTQVGESGQGGPIELEVGVTLEQYKARTAALTREITSFDKDKQGSLERIPPSSEKVPIDSSFVPPVDPPSTATLDTLLSAAPIPDTLHTATSDHIYPLPPSGPKRRIRELRVDIRTLDAAALFALETWRREVLGLEKLALKHPDSIWYKAATPAPTPSPTPEPETMPVQKKKMGRPRKSRPASELEEKIPVDQPELELEVPDNGNQEHSVSQVVREVHEGGVSSIDAFDEMMDGKDDTCISGPAVDGAVDAALADQTEDIDEDAIDTEGLALGSNDITPVIVDLTSDPGSPDIVMLDGFNREESKDTDFAPEPSPERPVKRPRIKKDTQPPAEPAWHHTHESATNVPSRNAPTSAISMFTVVPDSSPAEQPAAKNGGPSQKPKQSMFTPAAAPEPMLTHSRARPKPPSPTRRVSISPPKAAAAVTADKRTKFDTPPGPPAPVAGFVPFVRESMRMPSYDKKKVITKPYQYLSGRRKRPSEAREDEGESELEDSYSNDSDDVVLLPSKPSKSSNNQIQKQDDESEDEWEIFKM